MNVEELQNYTDAISQNFTKTNEQIVSNLLLYKYAISLIIRIPTHISANQTVL